MARAEIELRGIAFLSAVRAMLSTLSALGVAPSTLRRSTAPVHRSTQLPGAPPNVWLLPLPEKTLAAAKAIFDEALAPHLAAGMIEELATQPIPYRQLDGPRGRFFCMRAGSSTDEKKAALSDLAWISVDDDATFDTFADIFWSSGIAEALRPYIDCEEGVRLYSSFYVVRSTCDAPNLHTDWGDAVGCNAFTLLAPLEDYTTADFQLLYQNGDREGPLRQYTYKAGEAIVFSSKFVHSTEPGCAVDGSGRPHAFLCWTFGSDKEEHWPAIEPTIGGYQSRFMRTYDDKFKLTDIGRYLADKS